MSYDSPTTAIRQTQATPKERPPHRPTVPALLAMVIVVDQLGKWWAWRHAPLAKINYGGNIFVGDTISQWYADPTTGALLDLMDFGLLSAAAFVLTHHRPPPAASVEPLTSSPSARFATTWQTCSSCAARFCSYSPPPSAPCRRTSPPPRPLHHGHGTAAVEPGCPRSPPPPASSPSSA